jgi:hypothetical protein
MPHVSSHDFSTKLVTTLVRMLLCCTSHVPPYINLTLPIISKSLIELGENCLVKVLERKVVANGRDSRLFVKFPVILLWFMQYQIELIMLIKAG